jgi:hypothetical protein
MAHSHKKLEEKNRARESLLLLLRSPLCAQQLLYFLAEKQRLTSSLKLPERLESSIPFPPLSFSFSAARRKAKPYRIEMSLASRLASTAKRAEALAQHSREFDALVRAIGECRSKAEEDAIVAAEVATLKPRLIGTGNASMSSSGGERLSGHALKECLVRLVYIDMLGHDASWGYVKALQACSDTNLATKRVRRRRRRSNAIDCFFSFPVSTSSDLFSLSILPLLLPLLLSLLPPSPLLLLSSFLFPPSSLLRLPTSPAPCSSTQAPTSSSSSSTPSAATSPPTTS